MTTKIHPVSAKKVKATVSSTARKMIIEGKSDAQVWAALRRIYHLDESRRYYVRWYRAECARKGLIDREPAVTAASLDDQVAY